MNHGSGWGDPLGVQPGGELFYTKAPANIQRHLAQPRLIDRVFRNAFSVITEQLLQQSKGDLAEVMRKMFNHVSTMSGSAFGKLCLSQRGRVISRGQ